MFQAVVTKNRLEHGIPGNHKKVNGPVKIRR